MGLTGVKMADKEKDYQSEYYLINRETLRAKHREYYYSHKEQMKQVATEWRYANPDRYRKVRKERDLNKRYGISSEDAYTLWVGQAGLCPICGKELSSPLEKGTTSHIDHDHKTGMVRGILCGNCNRLLGLAREDPVILRSATRYLGYANSN